MPHDTQQLFVGLISAVVLLTTALPSKSHGTGKPGFDFSATAEQLSDESLQNEQVFRIANVAPSTDAIVEVVAQQGSELLQIDDDSVLPSALRPSMLALVDGGYVEIAVSFRTQDGRVKQVTDLHAAVTGLQNSIATLYNVSDYTLAASSYLSAHADDTASVHLMSEHHSNDDSLVDQNATAGITLYGQETLLVRFTARSAGFYTGSILFELAHFTEPEFYNINDAPVAIDDHAFVLKNQRIALPAGQGLLSNDTDADTRTENEILAIESFNVDAVPYATDTSVDLSGGAITISRNGAFEFLPAVDFTGLITGIEYRVVDTNGAHDYGTLSLLTLDRIPDRTIANVAGLSLTVTEDVNGDGYINREELSGRVDVSIELPAEAVSGQSVVVSAQTETITTPINDTHVLDGVIAVSFAVPADGEVLDLSLVWVDINGEVLQQISDTVRIDITATDKPQVEIVTDTDNSGFLSAAEYQSDLTVKVQLPASAIVNDSVKLSYGNEQQHIVLTPLDIAEGSITVVLPATPEGQAFALTAVLTDEAGNQSETGSDSVQIDTTPPPLPQVDVQVTDSATPTITGTLPVDSDYLLAVDVNGVTYVTGDGHLQKGVDGTWELIIAAADAVMHGVYDVTATVTDIAGNSTRDNTSAELTVDLEPPSLVVESVGLAADAAPVIRGTSDLNHGAQIQITTTAAVPLCVAINSDGQWNCRVRRLLNIGENELFATAEDSLGNQSQVAFKVTVASAADTDADGIADDIESTADTDSDGVPDYLDLDSDNDGILDRYESVLDSDNDGTRDFRDNDSDGDGINDDVEAGYRIMAENHSVGVNGVIDFLETATDSGEVPDPRDTDGDLVDDYRDIDSDNDGIGDELENAVAGFASTVVALDSDSDTVPDYRDLDSDQDGLPDIIEQYLTDIDQDGKIDELIDLDVDGLHDALLTHQKAQDADSDGLINSADLDSDGDGRSDLAESGRVDEDQDGRLDELRDDNSNGIPDLVDRSYTRGIDSDGDFIDDLYDADHMAGADFDADGIVDVFDLDFDGDGLLDSLASVAPSARLGDVYEVEPEAGALLVTGTGAFGSGCTMSPGFHNSKVLSVDLSLLLLLLSAVFGLGYRRCEITTR